MESVFKAAISPDPAPVIPPKCCPDEAAEPHPECLSTHMHRLRVDSRRRTRRSCRRANKPGRKRSGWRGRFLKERTVERAKVVAEGIKDQ